MTLHPEDSQEEVADAIVPGDIVHVGGARLEVEEVKPITVNTMLGQQTGLMLALSEPGHQDPTVFKPIAYDGKIRVEDPLVTVCLDEGHDPPDADCARCRRHYVWCDCGRALDSDFVQDHGGVCADFACQRDAAGP